MAMKSDTTLELVRESNSSNLKLVREWSFTEGGSLELVRESKITEGGELEQVRQWSFTEGGSLELVRESKITEGGELEQVRQWSFTEGVSQENTLVKDGLNTSDDEVKTLIRVNSMILSQKSSYFEKLFTSGYLESTQQILAIKISKEEEEPFKALLEFMHSDNLPVDASSILKVLVMADRFLVLSCITHGVQWLIRYPMSVDMALSCLELHNLFAFEWMTPVLEVAKKHLLSKFKQVDKFEEEIMELPLCALEAILSSDDVESLTEKNVYDLTLSWVRKNAKDGESSEILKSLLRHVRFPMMTSTDLRNVLEGNVIGPEMANDIVLKALFDKVDAKPFSPRAYIVRPVNVIALDSPVPFATIYWDIPFDQVSGMFPEGEVHSEKFNFMEDIVELIATCKRDRSAPKHYFGMMMSVSSTTDRSYTIEYKFAYRQKPDREFRQFLKNSHKWRKTDKNKEIKVGINKLIHWDDVIKENNIYFANGRFFFRIELSIKKSFDYHLRKVLKPK